MRCLVTLIFLRLHYINLINIFRFHCHSSGTFQVTCLPSVFLISCLFLITASFQQPYHYRVLLNDSQAPRQKGNKQLSAFNWSGWNHTVFCFVLGNDTHLLSTSVWLGPFPLLICLDYLGWSQTIHYVCTCLVHWIHLIRWVTFEVAGWPSGKEAFAGLKMFLVWASEERFLSSYHYVPLFSFRLFFCVNL